MTNKEAIHIIESIRENYIPHKTVQDDALDLAIKALGFVEKYYPITFAEYLKAEKNLGKATKINITLKGE